jgi:hypothetical protein
MENNCEAIMHEMINTGGEDGDGDYTEAEIQQDTYDIAVDPLFPNGGLSMEKGITATALATSLASSIADAKRTSKRTRATHRQRTGSYAKRGWRSQPIPFAALRHQVKGFCL